jgi:hypothetical protein
MLAQPQPLYMSFTKKDLRGLLVAFALDRQMSPHGKEALPG